MFIHPPAKGSSLTPASETVDESNRIISIVSSQIAPDIRDSVNALIAKKPLIAAAGLSAETAASANSLDYDHDTLSAALGLKLSPVTAPAAAVPVLAIDADVRRAVVAFGGVPLAPITM